MHRSLVSALTLLALHASPAQASPLLELAGSMSGEGGQQGRVAATGASAAYFNPALLADVPTSVTFGFMALHTGIDVSLDPRTDPRANVPNDLGNGAHADGSRWSSYPLGTDILQNGRADSAAHSATTARPRGAAGTGRQTQTYEAVGIVASFFDQHLGIGFYGLIPNTSFLRLSTFYVDEREQFSSNSLHPELYSDRLVPLAMAAGLGYRFNDKFSVGLGSTFVISAVASTPVFVADASQLTNLTLNADAKAHVGFAPHGGFTYNPLPRWRITGTVHAPQKQEVTAKINFLLASGLEQSSSFKLVFDWMPWQASLGTAIDLLREPDRTVSVVASAVYGRWSQYIDRHNERPLPGLAWQDTITGNLGLHSQLGKMAAHVDLQYKPTPVPLQFGRTNYVDNDRLGANFGAKYGFSVWDTQINLGVTAQLFWLVKRSVRKLTPEIRPDGKDRTPSLVRDEVPDDGQVGGTPIPGAQGLQTNNPGWPGFSSQGWIASLGLYLEVAL